MLAYESDCWLEDEGDGLVIVISGVVHMAMVICSADPAAACPNTEDSALVAVEDHSHNIVLVVEE